MTLSELKRERSLLSAVLGCPNGMDKICCPFHEEKTPSCKIYCTNDVWFFKCFGGCGKTGTVVDAVKYRHNLQDFRQALSKLEKDLGVKIDRDEEVSEIVLDHARAKAFLKHAQDTLANDFEVQEVYMLGKRKIPSLETLQKYGVGFVKDVTIREYHRWGPLRCWVFPITNSLGELQWVKAHRENCPHDQPKAFALPFGLHPPPKWEGRKLIQKPKHGTVSLFPAPELLPVADVLYMCPGELKTMPLLALGFTSLCTTQGEAGEIPVSLLTRIKRLFSKICLIYDNDKAGKEWRERLTKQLTENSFSAISFTASELLNTKAELKKDMQRAEIKGSAESPDMAEGPIGTPKPVDCVGAPTLPSNWRTQAPREDTSSERAELLRFLKAQRVKVFDSDSIETLRQARDVCVSLDRTESEITGVHQDYLDQYERLNNR